MLPLRPSGVSPLAVATSLRFEGSAQHMTQCGYVPQWIPHLGAPGYCLAPAGMPSADANGGLNLVGGLGPLRHWDHRFVSTAPLLPPPWAACPPVYAFGGAMWVGAPPAAALETSVTQQRRDEGIPQKPPAAVSVPPSSSPSVQAHAKLQLPRVYFHPVGAVSEEDVTTGTLVG